MLHGNDPHGTGPGEAAIPTTPAGDEDPLIAAAEEAVRADAAAGGGRPGRDAAAQEAAYAPEPTPCEPAHGAAGTAGPAGRAGGSSARARSVRAHCQEPLRHRPRLHERMSTSSSERVTDKGLPKRTPKISAPAPVPRPRAGGVDAEALRRRLGGFHRGATEGRRDVEAEIAEQTAQTPTPHHTARNTAQDQAQDAVRQAGRSRRIGGHGRGGKQLTAPSTFGLSSEARNLHWLLTNLVEC